MTKEQIIKMLKEVIQEVDYDTYKCLFEEPEDPDFARDLIDNLVCIVKENLNE